MITESTLYLMILSQDVTNPQPDRRHHYDWTKAEKWVKGTKFEIERVGEIEIIRYVERDLPSSNSMSAKRHAEQFAALRPHLVAYEAPAKPKKIVISEVEKLAREVCNDLSRNDLKSLGAFVAFRDELLARLKDLG